MKPMILALAAAVALGSVLPAEANTANSAYRSVQKMWKESRQGMPAYAMPSAMQSLFGLETATGNSSAKVRQSGEAPGKAK